MADEFLTRAFLADPLGEVDIINKQIGSLSVFNIKGMQNDLLNGKGVQDSIVSVNRSKAAYDDTASTIFTENWNDLTNWVTPVTPGVQVSGNKLYSTGSGGGASGANHSYQLGSNENLRAVFNISVPSIGSSGGIIVGLSKDAAGAIPSAAGSNAFGFYFNVSTLLIMDSGSTSSPTEGSAITAGDYIVTVSVDETYISLSVVKTDGTFEACARKLRSSFAVNNLYLFNSDNRGLTGMYAGKCSVRKGLQSISPRTSIEGVAKTIHWTGDGTQSFRVYLPKNYDSRIPSPAVICFHGNGTDETQWSINTNMLKMQKALVDAGFIVLTCNFDANKFTWGNTQSTNAYYQAYLFLKQHYAISSVVIYANSMGGIESLNALSENKIPCNAWAATSPTYNLLNCYQNALFTGVIQGAYGISANGSDYAAKTNGRDPALMDAKTFRGLPMMIIAANDDASVSKPNNGDLLSTTVQNTALELQKIDVASGGHSFDITPYTATIVNFLTKYSSF